MAVYTSFSQHDMESILREYDVGALKSFQPISEGIENTNYFVNSGTGQRWVLTVFENLPAEDLPYFCELTEFLANRNFKVPAPQRTLSDEWMINVKSAGSQIKQAVLVPRLSGKSEIEPSIDECKRVGAWLANMHLALQDFPIERPLERNLKWMHEQQQKLQGKMPEAEYAELAHYVCRYENYREQLQQCPQGTVHGDLFRDNVLFEQSEVSGVIDFYHACNASLIYDLAVVANDWCTKEGGYQSSKMDALIEAYQSVRPWTEQEKTCWPNALELAALRFWLSRLVSKYVPGYQQGSEIGDTIKDPDEMKKLLPV